MGEQARHIALDGPLNGDYISPAVAKANGYELIEWSTDEWAYLHMESHTAALEDGSIPAEIALEIEEELTQR